MTTPTRPRRGLAAAATLLLVLVSVPVAAGGAIPPPGAVGSPSAGPTDGSDDRSTPAGLASLDEVDADVASVRGGATDRRDADRRDLTDAPPSQPVVHSGRVAFLGQTLRFDGSDVVARATGGPVEAAPDDARLFWLVRLGDDGRPVDDEPADVIRVRESGWARIHTDRLQPGRYVLVYDGQPVRVEEGVGRLVDDTPGTRSTGTGDGGATTLTADAGATTSNGSATQSRNGSGTPTSTPAPNGSEVTAVGPNRSVEVAAWRVVEPGPASVTELTRPADRRIPVPADGTPVVAGETELMPGTELRVRLVSTGDTHPRFIVTEHAVVATNGTFATELPHTVAAGETAEVRVEGGLTAPVAFVARSPTPTPTPTTPTTPTPTPTPSTPTPDTLPGSETGSAALAVLVAVALAGVLVAIRRD